MNRVLNTFIFKNLNKNRQQNIFKNINIKNTKNEVFIKSRQFSTSKKHQFMPPIAWFVVKSVSKLGAIIIGRGSRKWFQNIKPHLKRDVILAHLNRNKIKYIVSTSTITIGGGIYYYVHLQTTPITNRTRFILFLPFQIEQVEELSKEAFNEEYGKKIVDKPTKDVKRILKIIDRLIQSNQDIKEIKEKKWHLTLVDDPVVNAQVYPSGHIIVFTGLLQYVKNDDELAAVLGHELSHAILQHTAENLSRATLIDFASIILILTIWTIFPSDFLAGILHGFSEKFLKVCFDLPLSRFLETEADEVGIQLAAKACFDVRHMPLFWRRQNQNSKEPELFSTHPSDGHRADYIEKLLPQALLLRDKCNCYKLPEIVELNHVKKD